MRRLCLLFVLVVDQKEQNDIAATNPHTVAGLKRDLADWQRSVFRSLNRQDYK